MAVQVVLALRVLQEALRARRSRLTFASPHPRAAESIMLMGGLATGGTNFNIVPAEFSFTVDRRPNPEEDFDQAKRELLAALEAVRGQGIPVEWELLQDARSALSETDGPLARALAGAIERVSGSRPSFTCCPGVLEIRVYRALGVPALAFGPGLIDRMHGPDEDVPISNLLAATAIYAETVVALTGGR